MLVNDQRQQEVQNVMTRRDLSTAKCVKLSTISSAKFVAGELSKRRM
jgi:hypothetical protein